MRGNSSHDHRGSHSGHRRRGHPATEGHYYGEANREHNQNPSYGGHSSGYPGWETHNQPHVSSSQAGYPQNSQGYQQNYNVQQQGYYAVDRPWEQAEYEAQRVTQNPALPYSNGDRSSHSNDTYGTYGTAGAHRTYDNRGTYGGAQHGTSVGRLTQSELDAHNQRRAPDTANGVDRWMGENSHTAMWNSVGYVSKEYYGSYGRNGPSSSN